MYRSALRISPNDKPLLLNLGLVYLKQEVRRQPLPLFALVVALDPHHEQARELLAVCRIYTGQPGPAIRELERLRAAHSRGEQILFLLRLAYLKDKKTDAAKSVFEQIRGGGSGENAVPARAGVI